MRLIALPLIHKLQHYGVRGNAINLIKSYLSNRLHHVKIQNSKSRCAITLHGVPQGSVLGPLLFLIYINDLNHAIINSTTIHFADDTSLICEEKSLKKLNKKVNRDLSLLVHWLRANKISLNASKTDLVLFRTKNKNVTKHLNFRLSGQQLKIKQTTKYLGVILDENLSWQSQINVLLTKLSRSTGVISKMRHYLSYRTMLSVYYALFDSHINYCSQVLGYITQETLSKIEKIQNNRHLELFTLKVLENQ